LPLLAEATAMPSTPRLTRRRLLCGVSGLALGAGCSARPDGSTARSATATDEPSPVASERPDGDGTPTSAPIDASLAGPWPTFGRDPGNTATTDASGPTAPVDAYWTQRLGSVGVLYPAVGPAGPYVATRRGALVALDGSGAERWLRALDDEVVTAPVVTPDRVVVGTVSGTVTAFTPAGEEAWSASLPEGLFAPHASDGTVFATTAETVVVAHQSAGVVAFDLAGGDRRWETSLSGRVHRPRVVDGTVYVSTDPRDGDGAVVALSLDDGTERWRATVPRGASVAPTVTETAVYTGTHRGLVLAVDREGRERWRTSVDDWVSTTPVVAADAVWVGTLDGRLFALERDGDRRATYDRELTTPVVRDDVLYAGSGEGVVAFDAVDGAVRWRTDVDGHVSPPLRLAGDRLYVGADEGDAYALAVDDGSVQWSFTARPATTPSPVVDDRSVYVEGLSGSLHGIVVESGENLWRPGLVTGVVGTPAVLAGGVVTGLRDRRLAATAPLDYGDPPRDPVRVTPRPSPTETPIAIDLPEADRRWTTELGALPTDGVGFADGAAYVPAGGELLRVDAATGRIEWRADVGSAVGTTPAVAVAGAEPRVVVGGGDGITAFGVTEGRQRWHVETPAAVRSSPAVREGRVVVGGDDGVVRALALADGTEQWRVETGGSVLSSPAVSSDTAFVGSDDGVVRALALADGTERWRVETGGPVRSSPAVADGTVFVGSRDRHLYALSAADGSVRWRHELDNWVDGAPAVAHGAVFVTDQSGACHCLATSTGG
jgi:outer membrane protein assembly factor BamB